MSMDLVFNLSDLITSFPAIRSFGSFRCLAGVGVDAGIDGPVELVLELDETFSGRAFPIRLVKVSSLVPECLDEVAPDSLHPYL